MLGVEWDPSRYYYLTTDVYEELKVPKDLRRRCRYSGCDRWLPSTESGAACSRCRHSRDYREKGRFKNGSSRSRKERRGSGYEFFVRTGVGDVTSEQMISQDHAAQGIALIKAYQETEHGSLLG